MKLFRQYRCEVGDTLEWMYNVNQRLAEIDVLSNDLDDLKNTLSRIQKNIKVSDEKNQNMIYEYFDVERIDG